MEEEVTELRSAAYFILKIKRLVLGEFNEFLWPLVRSSNLGPLHLLLIPQFGSRMSESYGEDYRSTKELTSDR